MVVIPESVAAFTGCFLLLSFVHYSNEAFILVFYIILYFITFSYNFITEFLLLWSKTGFLRIHIFNMTLIKSSVLDQS